MERRELAPGARLFDQGEAGDGLYLLSSGRVIVVLRGAKGQDTRLRAILGQTLVGEMGLYRGLPRGAAVYVETAAIVDHLSKEAMARMEQEDPMLAVAFHKFVIRLIAARLDFANRELAALEN